MIKKTKGFTLIELLVVIAIIGILSSVVLASLNSARNKGADAAVKSNMNGVRAQAELVYDDNKGSYLTPASVCADPNIVQAMNAAKNAGAGTSVNVTLATGGSATSVTCHASAIGWAIEAPLKSAGLSCVDSSGNSTTTTASTLTASKVTCG